jgi:hypothetical protein
MLSTNNLDHSVTFKQANNVIKLFVSLSLKTAGKNASVLKHSDKE